MSAAPGSDERVTVSPNSHVGGIRLTTRSLAVRWLLVAWIVAYPLIVGWTYLSSRADYAQMSAAFVGAALLLPWLVGVLVLALLWRRWRPTR